MPVGLHRAGHASRAEFLGIPGSRRRQAGKIHHDREKIGGPLAYPARGGFDRRVFGDRPTGIRVALRRAMRKEIVGDELGLRILAEFREMPGLTLTLWQAARLFNLELRDCERVLQKLVEDGLLTTNGRTFASEAGGSRWTSFSGHGEPEAPQWRLAGG